MIRAMRREDRAFVANSWLRSYQGSRYAGGLSDEQYRETWTPIVDDLLDRCRVDVYCNPEDDWHVMGWICYEPGVVHFAYTKTAFRDNRYDGDSKPAIATTLLGPMGQWKAYTFRTLAWNRYMLKHGIYGLEYNPRLRGEPSGPRK